MFTREMPLFLTLRARRAQSLTTRWLPPGGKVGLVGFRIIHRPPHPVPILLPHQDPLARSLHWERFRSHTDRNRCFPYGR